jgi:hypothetical protein
LYTTTAKVIGKKLSGKILCGLTGHDQDLSWLYIVIAAESVNATAATD